MADFKEVRLPLEVSAWMVGGPMWNTRTFKVQNGDVSRIGLWQYPLHKWEISAGERAIVDAMATKIFQMRVRGQLYGFRVLDHLDHTVNAGEGFLIATATAGVYQLVKRYTADGDVVQRIIKKPIPGTTYLYNGSTAISNAVDYTAGTVAVSGVSDPSVLSWTGLFDVPVAFTEDWLQLGWSTGGLLNWNNAHIMELQRIDTSIGTPPTLAIAGDPLPVMGTSTFGYIDPPAPAPAQSPTPTPAPAPAPQSASAPTTLTSGSPANWSNSNNGDGPEFVISIPANARQVVISANYTASGTFNVLYKSGSPASLSSYDGYFPAPGSMTVTSPAAGNFYMEIYSSQGVSGTITATVS